MSVKSLDICLLVCRNAKGNGKGERGMGRKPGKKPVE